MIRRYRKMTHYVEIAMGVLLIIVGVLLLSGQFQKLAQLSSFFDYYNELALGRLLLYLFFALVVLGIVPGIIASRKGRNFFTWWIFGATLFPIALAMALMLDPLAPPADPSGKEDQGIEPV